ncbi:glycoside hydrolase family 15 protein [Myceligenerans xiligouense]|uniref:GH15 family glucan-1,4-alpha-glucosidase n=1 Tax=Myceligenerans xiligouense TaxID=253184 RepID=A0A3N4YFJ2_9MICO|nr:glycoside hydrolase family 15 protein [Myceligenerans xiligouense]RPF19919.1 GH15 family glucan-1,4-alpha-glucosidase [Myceligenerans xiligouense]
MSQQPIADYALLSDRHSAALVGRDGSVDWLAFPRFDSPSVLGRLLDAEAGAWTIRPAGSAGTTDVETHRGYVPDTLVLRTVFTTPTGSVELTDALAITDPRTAGTVDAAGTTGTAGTTAPPDEDPHRLGEHAPHTLLRQVRGISGDVELEIVVRPRPEYGLIVPLLTRADGAVRCAGGASRMLLSSTVDWELSDGEARATVRVTAGQTVGFALQHTRLADPPPRPYAPDQIDAALRATIAAWRGWSAAHQAYDGPWRDLVLQSGRVLQGLSYRPTGAIIAAATTSLPEQVGGERNWDYRYAWVRDASFTMDALWVAACPDEADEFFEFMAAAAAHDSGGSLQIMYGVGGEHDLTERTLPHLSGWRGSRPVRVGNAAWTQPQLDVYGELLASAYRLRDQLKEPTPATREFLVGLADTAAALWKQPDNGIWEIRGAPRHFLFSKLMCWVALDRAAALAPLLRAGDRGARWRTVAAEIRAAILDQGWSSEAGAFTQSFGSADLDASALMIPIVGLLPGTDPRVLATIDAITDRLTDDDGLVYRYRTATGVDGLAGEEGAFLLCTYWLAQAQAEAGRVTQARDTFHRASRYANDLGLLAEEVADGELIGNFPQAFSHIGLINAAWAIQRAPS